MISTTYTTATRRLRALLAAMVAVTALAAAAPPAPAAAAETAHRFPLEPCYTIESRLNGYVLQVGEHTYTDALGNQATEPDPRLDARLVVGPKTPLKDEAPGAVYRDRVLHQVWVRYGDYLVSKLNGFALDLLGDATDPGTPVVINPVSAGDFTRTPKTFDIDADGYIVDRETGLVLDIAGNSTAPGAKVVAWKRKGLSWAANQRWTLVRVPDAACYPPPPGTLGEQPIHYVGGIGPGGTQGVPVIYEQYPGASFMSQFTWQPETMLLYTYAQFTGMVPNGLYIVNYATVRAPDRIRRNLPPPSYNSVEDNWATSYYVGEIIETMPEELYVRIHHNTEHQTRVIEARSYPHFDGSSDL